MGQGEDHMIMVTRQEPRPLQRQPALGLEIRALRTGAMPARVVPDAGDVTVWTRLHMAPQRRRPALHDRPGGFPNMGGQRVQRLVGGKGVMEERVVSQKWRWPFLHRPSKGIEVDKQANPDTINLRGFREADRLADQAFNARP